MTNKNLNNNPNLNDKDIDDVIKLIDSLMSEGSGRVRFSTDDSNSELKVDTFRSSDCGTGNNACCVPNEKVDDDDEF